MDLRKKFAEIEACHYMSVGSLQTDRPYPIIGAERIAMRFGPSVVLSLSDSPNRIIRVFIPKRFYSSFSDENIEAINSTSVNLQLIYRGTCVDTKAFKLEIQ
jgi:hypothetical protein